MISDLSQEVKNRVPSVFPKQPDICLNHLLDILPRLDAQHLVFIAYEVTSKMVRDGTGTLELELVLLHQLVHNGLRIFASDGQVINVGANVLPVVCLFSHPDVSRQSASLSCHRTPEVWSP